MRWPNLTKIDLKKNFGAQLVLGFLIMSALMVVISGLTTLHLHRQQHRLDQILLDSVPVVKATQELELTLRDLNLSITNYALERDPAWLQLNTQKQLHFRTWLAILQKRAAADNPALIDSLANTFQNYLALQKLVIHLIERGEKGEARELRTGALQAQADRLHTLCARIADTHTANIASVQKQLASQRTVLTGLVIGAAILSIILGIGLGLSLSRRFMRPLYRLVLNIKGATGSDNSDRVELGNISELDDLSQNVNLLINKIRAVNADLARSQQSLIRAEKLAALGRLAAGLAHEIRNPLTSIKMLLYPLQNALNDNPQYHKDLQIIHQEINRLEQFIQTFLNFARPQQPQPTVFRFHECLQPVLHLMTPQIKKQKVKLSLSLKTSGDWVKADRNQMQQVLHNIVLNALQAMPNGGILTISTESLINDAGLPYLQVRIADTGQGIAPAILNSLFDPFITTKEEGSGLGLAIVHQLVSANGGWVEAGNNPERGAYFTINLPQEKSEL